MSLHGEYFSIQYNSVLIIHTFPLLYIHFYNISTKMLIEKGHLHIYIYSVPRHYSLSV